MNIYWRPAQDRIPLLLGLLLMLPAAVGACDIRLSQPDIDYGTVRSSDMLRRSGGPAELGTRTLSLSVDCPAPRRFALRLDGPVAGDPESFAFSERGDVRLTLLAARVDDRPVMLEREGAPTAASALMSPGVNVRGVAAGQIAEGKHFTAQLRVNPRLKTFTEGLSGRLLLKLDAEISLQDY